MLKEERFDVVIVGGGHNGITAAAYTGFSEGANEVYAPALYKRTYQSSKVTVQNTETSDAAVTVEFFTRGQGSPVYTLNDTIPGGAQRTYDVWDYSQIPAFGPAPGTNNWVGAAKVTSPQDVAVVVTTLWNWGWMPPEWRRDLEVSPWLKMFQNAREWCDSV